MTTYIEPFLEERMEKAKAKAKRIAHGKVESESDLEQVFRASLSRRYNIPVFDTYFDDKTLDEIAYEVFLHKELDRKESGGTDEDAQKELTQVSNEDREDLFSDLVEDSEFAQRWAEASEPPPPTEIDELHYEQGESQ